MFMSYDSGATSASLDTLQKMGLELSETDIGVMGSVDKFGQMLFSMVWGRLLQLFPTKILLVSALITNAFFSFLFGVVFNKYLMIFAKFMQGSTESLQGVWGTVWTLANAPEDKKTQWMGLGGIAAGLGNGVGTAIAGFTTANGLPYSVAYIFQASVLALFWAAMAFCTPGKLLNIEGQDKEERREEADDEADDDVDSNASSSTMLGVARSTSEFSMTSQLTTLWENRLYVRTLLCVALVNFFIAGTQYIWTRTFVLGPWHINKNYVVASFLVVTGAGAGVGVALGPIVVDKSGGYSTDIGKYKTLNILFRFIFCAAVCSGISIAVVVVRVKYFIDKRCTNLDEVTKACSNAELTDPFLWVLWTLVFVIFMMLSATIATLTAINCESVDKRMQSFAAGTTVCFQNLLGYAAGCLVPGIVMDLVFEGYFLLEGYEMSLSAQLGIGFSFVCASNFNLLTCVFLAMRAAKKNIRV